MQQAKTAIPSVATWVAKILFALLIFAVLAAAITSRTTKRLNDFDQSFYLTIAYDLDRHGVFSNGIFDDVDSTETKPPPGMFFAPLYPWLIVAVTRLDTRFAAAFDCAVLTNHKKRSGDCDIYARPMHLMHALLLTLGVLAIAAAAKLLFGGRLLFYLAGTLATVGVAAEAELLSYIMTESLTFGLYSMAATALLFGLKTWRAGYVVAAGVLFGLLALARPSFLLLAPVMAVLIGGAGLILLKRGLRASIGKAAVFALAFVVVVAPWFARNAVSLGKLGFTEEYGAAALIERFAFNDMTAREFAFAFPYCLPEIGPSIVQSLAGDAMARFDWQHLGGFFDMGRGRRMALVQQHGKLDPVFGDILRAEMRSNGWGYLASTIPLAWCGLWVGGLWSLLLLPMFAWACVAAVRRGQTLFLVYAFPPLLMVGVHAALANHYIRYNLILIGPIAIGAAWMIARTAASWRAGRVRPSPG
jgi:hypothetical protein